MLNFVIKSKKYTLSYAREFEKNIPVVWPLVSRETRCQVKKQKLGLYRVANGSKTEGSTLRTRPAGDELAGAWGKKGCRVVKTG